MKSRFSSPLMPDDAPAPASAIIIGGGPAGLMAAEQLLAGGVAVDLYDAMPSVGRKFLMAGKGGLNITHAEPASLFRARYGARRAWLEPIIDACSPADLRAWMRDLGVGSFVGTSGRVFPTGMKAAPLLRAWLARLRQRGLRLHVRHRWLGWDARGDLRFSTPWADLVVTAPPVLILALGGGSWSRLGSTGAWVPWLGERGIAVAPLRPANCGFDIAWSQHFAHRFAGQPLKTVAASFTDQHGVTHSRHGEFMITSYGVEGGLIYAFSSGLRDQIFAQGSATLYVDLLPEHDLARVVAEVCRPRGSRSFANHLQGRLGIKSIKSGLLHEVLSTTDFHDAPRLAATIKALPLHLTATRPIDEAISTAGGVCFEELDERLMLRARPGLFCAGEMLDWEAPTGGYLLTACLATGHAAGKGALEWLQALS